MKSIKTTEIAGIDGGPKTKMPADLKRALEASPKSSAQWNDITPIARRDWIYWIITAKQAETRKRRIERACENLSAGKKRVCCFGGVKWLMKNGDIK